MVVICNEAAERRILGSFFVAIFLSSLADKGFPSSGWKKVMFACLLADSPVLRLAATAAVVVVVVVAVAAAAAASTFDSVLR